MVKTPEPSRSLHGENSATAFGHEYAALAVAMAVAITVAMHLI